MNKVLVFCHFLSAQRFPDICDSWFENTEIQFQPDSHNMSYHTWFGLDWEWWNDDDWRRGAAATVVVRERGQSEATRIQFKLDSWNCNWISLVTMLGYPQSAKCFFHLTKGKFSFKCSNWISFSTWQFLDIPWLNKMYVKTGFLTPKLNFVPNVTQHKVFLCFGCPDSSNFCSAKCFVWQS